MPNTSDYGHQRENAGNLSAKQVVTVLLASLLSTSVIWVIRSLSILESVELQTFDRMVRLYGNGDPDPRLTVVAITETDIRVEQTWPLPDRTIAGALATLQQYQPRVIGLDIYRDVPQPPGHFEWVEQLKADNLIAIKQVGVVSPPPSASPDQISFNDLAIDLDNAVRRNLMYAEYDGEKLYSFALKVSQKYLESRLDRPVPIRVEPDLLRLGDTIFPTLKANSGGYQLPPSEVGGRQILIDYRSEQIARLITLTQLLDGDFNPDWIRDRAILIGTIAPSLKDLYPTPYSAAKTEDHMMPGVLIHAQMVSQILDVALEGKSLFWFWPQWVEILWLWGWSILGGILAMRFDRPLSLGLLGGASAVALWVICFVAFMQTGWIPLVPPALGLVATAGIVLAYKVLYGLSYDPLTGLPNRILLNQQIRHLSRTRSANPAQIALLFLDLDRFRIINEGFGHQIGDRLILSTSHRLKTCLPPQTFLARVGGDEFAILMSGVENSEEAIALAHRVQKILAAPFNLGGPEMYTTASIGIACSPPSQELAAQDLLRDAHTAMYRAKALGQGRHEIFISTMHTQALQQLELESDLREAIKNREFQLHYQPIINLRTEQIVGFEALVRWISPKRGFVSPGEFIPLSEDTGLIIPLGEWILEQGCNQLAAWHEKYPRIPPFVLSINLSTRQLSQPNLVACVDRILDRSGVNRESIKLEITESAIMDDVDEAIALLEQLKTLGIKLSMDDFGTGYSSLSYLHRFPMDTLKVDQSFIRRMDESRENTEIVKTIIMLGHNLKMDVVAEGIETEQNVKLLQTLKCEYGQGYYFSKPLPVEAVEKLLTCTPDFQFP
ncbi:MAG: EAL domain-containing protein [Limnospira sp.]